MSGENPFQGPHIIKDPRDTTDRLARGRKVLVLGLVAFMAACGSHDTSEEIPTHATTAAAPPSAEAPQHVAAPTPAKAAKTAEAYPDANPENKLVTPAQRIVNTALAYAWPTEHRGIEVTDAKPNYAKEFAGVLELPPDDPNTSDDDSPITDCSTFEGFVMRKSGVDPNYVARETNAQMDYLNAESSPDNPHPKYQRIMPTDTSQLQPGDILIFNQTYDTRGDTNPANDDKDGHTYIYTGNAGPDGKPGTADDINAVGASWYDNVPQRTSVRLTQTQQNRNNTVYHFTVFRFIGAAS